MGEEEEEEEEEEEARALDVVDEERERGGMARGEKRRGLA